MVCARSTPFPPFAASAAALGEGTPVDVGAGVARWFTAGEMAADGPAVHYARALLEQADRRAWAAALDAIATYDASARVAAVRVPTTSVAAELDPVSTPEAMATSSRCCPRPGCRCWPERCTCRRSPTRTPWPHACGRPPSGPANGRRSS